MTSTAGGTDTATVNARLLHPAARTGPLPRPSLADLVDLLERAGLTGRGGADFPTATKLRAVAAGRDAVVVGNAMEGEPLSYKDAVLLRHAPGLVLDGLIVLGAALGTRRLILAIGPDVPSPSSADAAAVGVDVRRLAGGFLAGQESALVNQLEGRVPVPRDRATRVSDRGVGGRPTLVLNAETLAQLALVVRHGAAWFRQAGTAADPGTSLFTLSGAIARPGVVELPRGIRLADALRDAGPRDLGAVLVGGYHGAWLPASAIDVGLTRSELDAHGASVGAGVLHVIDRRTCHLRETARIAAYLADESAGQCGPCVNGLPRVADSLGRLAALDRDPHLPAEIERLSALVRGRGACAHPDGTVRLVLSALRLDPGHVAEHLTGRCTLDPTSHADQDGAR